MKKKLISSFDYIYLEALVNTKKDKTNSKHTVLYRTCNKFTTLGLATKKSQGKKTIFAPTVKGLATVFAIQTLASSNKNYFQFGKAHRIKEINKQMDYAKKVVSKDNDKNKSSQKTNDSSASNSASQSSEKNSAKAKTNKQTTNTSSDKNKNYSESPSLDSSSNSKASQNSQTSSNLSTSSSSESASTESKPTSSKSNSSSSVGHLTRVQLHHDKPTKSSSSDKSTSQSSSVSKVASEAKVDSSSSSDSSSISSTEIKSGSSVANKVSSSAGNTSNVGTVGNTKKLKHQTTIAKVEHHIKYGSMPHSRIVHERNLKRAKEEIKAQRKQEKHDKKVAKDDKVKARIKKLAYHVPSPKHVDKSWTKLIIAYFFFGIIWFAIWLHLSNLLLATNSVIGIIWIVISLYITYVVIHGCNNIHRWHMREKKQGLQNIQK